MKMKKGKPRRITLRQRCKDAIEWLEGGHYLFLQDIKLEEIPEYVFGRPSKFHNVYCVVALHLGDMGFSVNEIAGALRICRQTTTNWKNKYPHFLAAMEESEDLRLAWFERSLRGSASGATNGSATSIKFGLTNIRPDLYKNKQEFEGRVDTTVEEVGMSPDTAGKLSVNKRRELLEVLKQAGESDTDD